MSILTGPEKLAYRLAHGRTPLTQAAIAAKLGVSQGTASRVLASAREKVEQLRAACLDAGGDPDVVDRVLAGEPPGDVGDRVHLVDLLQA